MFYTQMTSYNQAACAATCDSTPYCKGFSIYYERDPTLNPGPACKDPSAMTQIRCAFYTQAVSSNFAVNAGEWRSDFAVVVSGANGYSKNN